MFTSSRHALLTLFLVASALFAQVGLAQTDASEFTISDIRIEGLQRVSSGAVFSVLPVSIGDAVNQALLANAIKSVFATGSFENVQVARDQDVLVIEVVERPSISEINFEGNKAIKTDQLLDGLKSAGLYEGQVLRRATLEGMRKEVLRQYVTQGRYDSSVVAEVILQPRNRVVIDVTIDEGKVSRIKHINIIGNKDFERDDLLSEIELRDSGWFLWMNGKNKYAKEKFESDIETIESFYFDQGYATFRIIDAQVSVSPDKKGVYLSIVIDEGEQYTFGEVGVSGDVIVDEALLKPFLDPLEGEGFSQGLLTSLEEYFTDFAGNVGYTFAEVLSQMTLDEEAKTVDVKFFFNPGKRTYVNSIEFSGNYKTKDEVLRREMRQMEMAPASNAKIEYGRVRLNRLGFFKETTVDTQPTPGADDLVDVVYTVEEQPSGSIGASIGYAQDSGVIIGANLQQNNFLGNGTQVGIGLNTSDYQTSANFSYTNPYYTEDGVSRGFSVFFRETNYDEINVASFSSDSYGGAISFGYPLSEIERLNFSFGLTNTSIKAGAFAVQEIQATPFGLDSTDFINQSAGLLAVNGAGEHIAFNNLLVVDNAQPFASGSSLIPALNAPGFLDIHGSEFNTFTLSTGYIRSTLNRGQLATRGSQLRVNAELSVPGSDLEFYKLHLNAQAFVPLTNALTLRFSTKLGYGDGYGDTEGLPFFENFYAGGFGSVRGFKSNTLGPQSTPALAYSRGVNDSNGDGVLDTSDPGIVQLFESDGVTPALDANGDPVFAVSDSALAHVYYLNGQNELTTQVLDDNDPFGGNVLVTGSMELLFPLPFIKDQRTLRSVFFLDAGNVFSTNCGKLQPACSNFDASELRYSVGFGLNWLSGFGPLSFSLGKSLKDGPFDEREFFQFSLGQSF